MHWLKSPPRFFYEHAVIDVASEAQDRFEAFRVMADACQTKETDAERIAATLRDRARVPGKGFLLALLDDLASGACSVLEREWLGLERRHGLRSGTVSDPPRSPAGRRTRCRPQRARVLVELDGRAYHDSAAARDKDFSRDLEAAVASRLSTVRLSYGQVLRGGCLTVRQDRHPSRARRVDGCLPTMPRVPRPALGHSWHAAAACHE